MRNLTNFEVREGNLTVTNRVGDGDFSDPLANEELDNIADRILEGTLEVNSLDLDPSLLSLEVWKRAVGYQCSVSNMGRVRSLKNKVVYNTHRRQGKHIDTLYVKVTSDEGKRGNIRVTTLVWDAHGTGGQYKLLCPHYYYCSIWNLLSV